MPPYFVNSVNFVNPLNLQTRPYGRNQNITEKTARSYVKSYVTVYLTTK